MKPFSKCYRTKRFLLLLIPLFLLSSFLLLFFLPQPGVSFQEMTDQLFFEDITTDTLSLHYTLAHPSHYSITSYPLTLPKYNENQLHNTYSRIENALSNLSHMDTSDLCEEDSYCHTLLTDYFSKQKEGFPYTYYEEYFSPSSGIVANFPVLMAEYTFRTKQDVTDYLALLADTPNYFQSFFHFQQQRAEKGYGLSFASLQEVMEQCNTIITKEALEENSHFLQITFRERLAYLVAKETISGEQALQYIKKNNSILKNTVLPAFQDLKVSLETLLKYDFSLEGLYKKNHGKEYYQWLIQKQIGCSLLVPEILEKLEQDYDKNLYQFLYFQRKITEMTETQNYDTDNFPITDRNLILDNLQSFALEDFPSLSEFSDRPINTTIKSVSTCMEDFSSPAFYMIPPIDDIWKNTIYINNSSTPEGLELFTTLAHEGYPGHLYQTVYYQLYSQKQETPLIRHLMNYSGYVEGWAIYCEFYAYQYATRLYPEETRDFYSLWHNLLLTDRKLQLAVLSILDIKLHYYDDSYETAKDLLNQYGITDEETIADIHRYILEEPGNYLKYYVGYLLITELKEKAEDLMGSAFSDYKFHEFILQCGPSDFDNLERRMRELF